MSQHPHVERQHRSLLRTIAHRAMLEKGLMESSLKPAMNVSAPAGRSEIDFSNRLSAGRQQQTETKLKKRKEENYAKQSQNTKGLQIKQP